LLALQNQLRQRETQVFVLEEQTIELLEHEDKRLKDKEKQLRNWEKMLRKEVKKRTGDENANGETKVNETTNPDADASEQQGGNEHVIERDDLSSVHTDDDSDASVVTEGNEDHKQKREKRKSREHCCVS
jgi:hypothetical protein